MTDVLIIGGGISGLATAFELARTGIAVTLIEARHLGAMASTWTLGGVRQSGRDLAELPLALAAVERWTTLDDELGAATGYRQGGNLRLARTPAEVETIRAMVTQQAQRGLDVRFLDTLAAVREIAPAIGDAVLAASFCPGDGHADPDGTVAAYAAAARRHGACIIEGVAARALLLESDRVIGVATTAGDYHAGHVVLACGLNAPAMLEPLGLALPLAAKRVCVMQTVATSACFGQVFGVANADCAGRQEIDGRFRITTGIGDWPGNPERWTEATLRPALSDIEALVRRTTPLLPVLSGLGLERVWGGLIDLTPDALPVLDAPATHPGLVIGAGFSGHGFGIGPVTGEILAGLVRGKASNFDLAPFRLDRFAPGSGFAPLTLHG